MAYLKTILTYHLPSQAEVDRSLLESYGITVNLLNAHTTRNELGTPFYIQLQVPDEEVDGAVAIIRRFQPERFGSPEKVRQIERELRGLWVWIVLIGLLAVAAYLWLMR